MEVRKVQDAKRPKNSTGTISYFQQLKRTSHGNYVIASDSSSIHLFLLSLLPEYPYHSMLLHMYQQLFAAH